MNALKSMTLGQLCDRSAEIHGTMSRLGEVMRDFCRLGLCIEKLMSEQHWLAGMLQDIDEELSNRRSSVYEDVASI